MATETSGSASTPIERTVSVTTTNKESGTSVFTLIHNILTLRRKAKALSECASGDKHTHSRLANVPCARLGPLALEDRYICKNAVDLKRLLYLTRRDLYEAACFLGGDILLDEEWKCTVFKRKKDIYVVVVRYEVVAARTKAKSSTARVDPHRPVALDKVSGSIPGLMTIITRNQ